MSNEEVRIVAVLDNTDVDNGVKRVENAARRMKQVVEEAGSSAAPGAGAADAGEKAASSFSNAFIKRLVLRDAIYGVLRGLGNIGADVAGDFAAAFGAALPKGGLAAGFEKWIADGLFGFFERTGGPKTLNADVATRRRHMQEIEGDEEQRFRNELYKEDPRTFPKSSAQVGDDINRLNRAQANAAENNEKFHILQATGHPAQPGANITDGALALITEDTKKRLAQSEKEFQFAKEKERMLASEEKHEESFEAAQARKAAAEEKREKTAADRAAKHAAAVEKNHREHELAEERSEESKTAPNKDLHFTEKLLDHQKATSAIMINGGLFGRNDANAALVQHAQQQIGLLRNIDASLKAIRKEKSDLTLL